MSRTAAKEASLSVTGPVASAQVSGRQLPSPTVRVARLLLLGVPLLAAGCAERFDQPFCSDVGCGFSEWEWQELTALAGLPETPPVDRTNKYVTEPKAAALGHMFYFDGRFAGPSTQQDSLRRPAPYGRAPRGQATGLTCNVCHDLRRGGIDSSSVPGNISIGSGWADTNALSVLNAAYYKIQYWSGRADSMWSQAVSSSEGNNMNGNRLATAWLINDYYRGDMPTGFYPWDQVFGEHPFPLTGKSADVRKLVDATGQCKLVAGLCPTELGCRAIKGTNNATGCWPRFPLEGRLGTKKGCQPGDPDEPSGDAFDCMDAADQDAITRILVNWAKALAAYEAKLVSRESAFDRFVTEMKVKGASNLISPEAQRGARLFVGKAACNDCHNTPLLSDSGFYNIGIAQVGPGVPTEADCPDNATCDCVPNPRDNPETGKHEPMWGIRNCMPWGVRNGLQRLRGGEFLRTSKWSDEPNDVSRQSYVDVPLEDLPVGAWRTPSLRDVALTAPYMHTGAFQTLEDVVRHYNNGGSTVGTGPRSPRIKPLGLTEAEISDLVAFLKTLNGQPLPADLVAAPPLPQ